MVDIIHYGSERVLIRHCGSLEVGSLEKQSYFCGSVTLVSGRCSCGTIRVVEIVIGG